MSNRLGAILAFVTAGLAFTAVAIDYSSGGDVNWTPAFGGLLFLAMGLSSWFRSGEPKS